MRKLCWLMMLPLWLMACNGGSEEQKNSGNTAEGAVSADTAKAKEEDVRTRVSYLNDYAAIEQLFGNENWMQVDKKDTSFFYFSRLGDFQFNTYVYKREKGDSANVEYGKVITEQGKLAWQFHNQPLYVNSASPARLVLNGKDSARYVFVRQDHDHLQLTYPDKHTVVLTRTLPFSLFLVRSRYDYANGTKLAFDTTNFTRKRK
jgi:hypothetical protein